MIHRIEGGICSDEAWVGKSDKYLQGKDMVAKASIVAMPFFPRCQDVEHVACI